MITMPEDDRYERQGAAGQTRPPTEVATDEATRQGNLVTRDRSARRHTPAVGSHPGPDSLIAESILRALERAKETDPTERTRAEARMALGQTFDNPYATQSI